MAQGSNSWLANKVYEIYTIDIVVVFSVIVAIPTNVRHVARQQHPHCQGWYTTFSHTVVIL